MNVIENSWKKEKTGLAALKLLDLHYEMYNWSL